MKICVDFRICDELQVVWRASVRLRSSRRVVDLEGVRELSIGAELPPNAVSMIEVRFLERDHQQGHVVTGDELW